MLQMGLPGVFRLCLLAVLSCRGVAQKLAHPLQGQVENDVVGVELPQRRRYRFAPGGGRGADKYKCKYIR